MKPCDQTCPKCGAFPADIKFQRIVTQSEYEEARRQAEILAGLLVLYVPDPPNFAEHIACNCPRCKHHWRTKPMDAEAKPQAQPEAPKPHIAPTVGVQNPYGFCPVCGAPCQSRERRPNGNDKCENGHIYPSREAVKP